MAETTQRSLSKEGLPVTVYSAESVLRRPLRLAKETLKEFFVSRELIWILFLRDLRAQYRQSLMGYFWLFVPPLVTTLIWFFLNNQKIIQVETDIPYPVFVLIGTTIWSSFVALVQKPLAGFNDGKPVFMKLRVPHEAFIASAVLRAIFELVIRVSILIPVILFFRISLPATAWFFPVALFSVVLLGTALGLILIPIGSLYTDIGNAVGSFIGLFMYTAPVVFPVPEGEGILAVIMRWNPLTPGIALCRDLLTTGSTQWLVPALIYSGISLVIILLAAFLIRVAMPHLVARMGM